MLSDVMISAFLLLSLLWSRKPADKFHMFGHGRAQNVAAVVSAAILIFFMSAEAFREAAPKLLQTPEANGLQNTSLAFIVIIAGMIMMVIPSVDILRTKTKGASLKAQLVALLKDETSYVIALISVALVSQGYPAADAVASLTIAFVIAIGGIYLLKDNIRYLLGRAPAPQFFDKLTSTAKSVSGVLGVHDLKAEYVGPNIIQASLHVQVANGTPIEEADRIAHEVEKKVSKEVNCNYCVIHVDPANK